MTIWFSGTGSGDKATVDVNKAGYVRPRGQLGDDLGGVDRSTVVPGVQSGVSLIGTDGKVGRAARALSDGAVADGRPVALLHDPVEGAAVNTNTWRQTTSTMTITQASGVITLNANGSVANGAGAMHTGQRLAPLFGRGRLLFRSRQQHSAHSANTCIELGFLTPSSVADTSIGSGAVWRKYSSGQYVPVLSSNGGETLGDPISNATLVASVPATDFAVFEVEVDESGAWFRILKTDGSVVSEQRVDLPPFTADFTVTRLTPGYRIYNGGNVVTAVRLLVAETSVTLLDAATRKPWAHQMSSLGMSGIQSPTAYTQTANYTLNGIPTVRGPTLVGPGEATLGGQIPWTNGALSFAASDTTDAALFGFLSPSPYSFTVTGIRISNAGLGAANGANPYTVMYSLALNCTTLSFTAGASRIIPIGFQFLAASAPNGTLFNADTVWTPTTPLTVLPGRYLHLLHRIVGSSLATASQVIRTVVAVDGYFE